MGGGGFPGAPGFRGRGKDEGGGYEEESGKKRDSQEAAFGSQGGGHAGYAPGTVSREMGNQIRTLFQPDCDDKGKQAGFPAKGPSGAHFLIRNIIL